MTDRFNWKAKREKKAFLALADGAVFHDTNPGDIVLDNTSGSGSFLVAALMEGRNFVGIEKNADTELFKGEKIDYIKKTKDRLRAAWQHLDAEKREIFRKCNVINDF